MKHTTPLLIIPLALAASLSSCTTVENKPTPVAPVVESTTTTREQTTHTTPLGIPAGTTTTTTETTTVR